MRESEIETKVCNHAKYLGWLCYKWVSPGNRSVPDRIFFRNGKTIIIEFKAKGKKPTKLQQKTINKLQNQDIPTYVIDDVSEGIVLFNNIKE
jgi:Holliday junction resolvase